MGCDALTLRVDPFDQLSWYVLRPIIESFVFCQTVRGLTRLNSKPNSKERKFFIAIATLNGLHFNADIEYINFMKFKHTHQKI